MGDTLNYEDFSKAVEMNMNDSKVDPFILVFFLLKMFFNNQSKVRFSEFKTFFGEFITYFEGNDIDLFLNEV